MRNILIFGAGLLLFTGLVSSCSGKREAEKARLDSIRTADSLAVVEYDLQQARQDSILQDSLLQASLAERYKNALSLNPVEKVKNQVPESSFFKIEWTCDVTNNSGIPLTGNDYQITFDETYEDGNADGLFDVTKQRSIKGVSLSPDSTAQVVLTGRANTQELSNPKIKMLISEEEFLARLRQARK